LAASAQELWRDTSPTGWGGEGRYEESGLLVAANKGDDDYVWKSFENVTRLARVDGTEVKVQKLDDKTEIQRMIGTGGHSGDWGYINRSSGWADAEAAMKFARRKVEDMDRVALLTGTAKRLLFRGRKVIGVELDDSSGGQLHAELVILATGAWTGTLVDLRGRATATGQVLAYVAITAAEQSRLGKMPVILNISTGHFIIPPRNGLLKVARHGYGYTNRRLIPHPHHRPDLSGDGRSETMEISTPPSEPSASGAIPGEGSDACRAALGEMIPSLAARPFSKTRICWYTDTPSGDFIVTYHPDFEGLFLATGGSGHAFKFLPVIGEKVVDAIEGVLEEELNELWRWREERIEGDWTTEDGSRGGRRGMVLGVEMGRTGSKL